MRAPGAGPWRYLGDTMKKQMKKLALSRETLVSLEANLEQVAGGYTLRCQYSGYGTCTTCDNQTCGTNFC